MWATLGAGRAAAGVHPAVPFPVSHMGKGPERGVMASALKVNRRHHTLARPGALGDALHRQGLRTAAIGGVAADPWDGWLAAADSQGRIDCTEFGGDDLLRSFDRCAHANLMLIAYPAIRTADGDPASWDDAHKVALRRADSLLADLLRRLRSGRDLLIVLSPTGPSYPHASQRTMGPVIVVGAGRGLLTSLSTRRAGVVTAADIAPTALTWLGVATPPEISGRPMAVLPMSDAERRVAQLDRRISATFAERFVIVLIASAAEVSIVIVLAIWWLLRPRSARRWGIVRAGPLLGYALLLALLPLPWFGVRPTGQVAAIWLGLSVAIAGAAYLLGPLAGPAAISAAGAALIACDIAAGGDWLRYSVLGSDTIIGGRFYGIGNERAALLVCSLALAVGFAVQRWGWRATSRASVGLVLVGGVVLVGLPVLGANWGSAIVLTVGLGLTWARLGAPRLRAGQVAALSAAAILVGAGLIVIDGWWDTGRSHIGSAASFLMSGDLGAAWATYARKMANNWALIGLSPLAIGFLGLTAAMLWLVARPPARLSAVLSRYRAVTAAMAGCIAAIAVGMVVNDTGSVAGAIISIMVMQTLAYLVLLPGESDASAGR